MGVIPYPPPIPPPGVFNVLKDNCIKQFSLESIDLNKIKKHKTRICSDCGMDTLWEIPQPKYSWGSIILTYCCICDSLQEKSTILSLPSSM